MSVSIHHKCSLWPALKISYLLGLVATVLMLSGCTATTKPSLPPHWVSTKAKKPTLQPPPSEEQESDSGVDLEGPAVLRKNLPLAGTKWEWASDLSRGQSDMPGNASSYRLEFKPNGWFGFQADCKHGSGVYEINGSHIALAVIKASRAACPGGSHADDFLSALEGAKTYWQADGKLYFEHKREVRTLVFVAKP